MRDDLLKLAGSCAVPEMVRKKYIAVISVTSRIAKVQVLGLQIEQQYSLSLTELLHANSNFLETLIT